MFRHLRKEIVVQDIKKGYDTFYEGYLISPLRGCLGEGEGMKKVAWKYFILNFFLYTIE